MTITEPATKLFCVNHPNDVEILPPVYTEDGKGSTAIIACSICKQIVGYRVIGYSVKDAGTDDVQESVSNG